MDKIPTDKLSEVGMHFLKKIREGAGLDADEAKPIFEFVIFSFVSTMPKDRVPTLEEIVERFQKVLPSLTTQTCVFMEQVKSLSENVWQEAA